MVRNDDEEKWDCDKVKERTVRLNLIRGRAAATDESAWHMAIHASPTLSWNQSINQ